MTEQEAPPRAATPGRLRALAARGLLDAPALERALRITGHLPDRTGWRSFIERALLVLGVLFLLSGIFFFFAYNWADMHYLAKLAVVEVAILIAVGFSQWLGLGRGTGQVALLVASLLVGALLAVFGQAYQTGANSYRLFLNWALLILPWALIGNFAPLWFALLVLVNLAYAFFCEQVLGLDGYPLLESLFLLNAVALLCWEIAESRGSARWLARWFPRLIAVAAFFFVTFPTLEYIFNWSSQPWEGMRQWFFAPGLYVAFLAAVLLVYLYRVRDLFMLTLALASVIVVITALVGRAVDFDGTFIFLGMSALVIGQATLAVLWLRRVQAAWEGAE